MHTLPNGVRIPTIEALNDAIADGNHEFAIVLAGGMGSMKTIHFNGKHYTVEHSVDGTTQRYTAKQLFDPKISNIGIAMQKGAFITHGN